MKKQLLIVSALFISMLSFSQGIEFEHGTWKEVLEKAQLSNKPIFIDFYSEYCGPCKKMSVHIFPLAEVGRVYNANFVCYQVNGDKGEGIKIAKKYGVISFPTFLFINSDGTLFSRYLGTMEADRFIGISVIAKAEMNDPKPLVVWEKEYVAKKNDPAFLLDYMTKRSNLDMSNTSLLNEYLKLIPEKARTSAVVTEWYKKEGHFLKVNSLAYANLQKNKEYFEGKLHGMVGSYLIDGIINSLREAGSTKNQQLFTNAMLAYDQSPEYASLKSKDELYLEYFKRTKETDKYLNHAKNVCNNQLMTMSLESIENKDRIHKQISEQRIISGLNSQLDSTHLAVLNDSIAHSEKYRISEALNNISMEVLNNVTDMTELRNALCWSKRSVEICPRNPNLLDTYAKLLYKLGQKEEAIIKVEEAIRQTNKRNKRETEGLGKTLSKMKAEQKTEKVISSL